MANFLTYTCDACGEPFCERVLVMNLVLDLTEEAYCLDCLAQSEGRTPAEFYNWVIEYVMARDCFKGPWEKFDATQCPKLIDKTCFCSGVPV